uniref:Ig-like domain-containing protein n=1 Tax=Sarcophilus harrisii TaxID=9305 RepID=A0A7N4V1I0_SARHA
MMLSSLFSCILMVLLTAGPSESVKIIRAIKGQSATLPCTYSVHKGVTSMCWGRAWCPVIRCSNEIIWTDGHEVTFQHSNRYHLKENLSQGIVSLTIENVTEADTGFYCCRVQISNWLNDQKISMILKVEQGVNDTVTGTSEGYQGEHQMAIVHDQVVTTNKGIYIGVGVFVGVLLIVILLVFVLKRYFYNGKNAHVLSLTFLARGRERMERTTTEDINHAVDNGYEIEDNSYIIEKDNIHIIQTCNEKQQPSKFSHNILN